MSKQLKRIGLIVLVLGIGIGGFRMYHYQEKQKMIAIAHSKEARQLYEDYLKQEDPNAFTSRGFIESYEVNEDSMSYNPMGGLMIQLIINNNKDMTVSLNLIDNGDGKFISAYYVTSKEFWETQEQHQKE
ncbi:DUF1310 family protein [Streptococcus sp. zg-86]|uniref:DUF1310 family protein n=1 Tax=Streptococcus zhangguiae TaxID=2664091 RepID=A0A6I4RU36_9STRE|nr:MULTISPECIES: DUF1310 family protein [unclassified Streptococcus]MTB64665.1 DUF1310 family protein [Streptococcus sp. zg-86]MTB90975.1 DUF1310 family protein [Streptococcus sp. zg-36]MWV56602.1 DUF1310 family protein [Streptococcus sp. zg-70]QTH48562.1 DUF1310 family protein [Streptococcus sp. zg-86]